MIQIKQYSPTTTKIKALIYGASGVGKTSFAGTAKNVIFASAEGGLLSIADKLPNYVEIKSLQDLKDLYRYLLTNTHNFETLVIDSITEINEVIKLGIEKKTGRPMQLQDWGVLAKDIKSILREFRDLAETPKADSPNQYKPINVLFIAQETVEAQEEGGTISKIVPSLNGKASTEIAYFMDIVGYLTIDKNGVRKVITASNPRLLTKDRTGLIGNETEVSFQAWIEIVKNMKVEVAEKVVENIKEENSPKTVAPAQTTTAPAKPITPEVMNAEFAKIKTLVDIKTLKTRLSKVAGLGNLTDEQKSALTLAYSERIAELENPGVAGLDVIEA